MAKRITLVILILLQTLHVGDLSIKDAPLWQLHRYKYTELLRLEPFSWCPYKSYLIIDKYVEVRDRNNTNHLIINADIVSLVKDDADYNKAHAKRYKGKPKTRLKKIYRYCRRTEYVAHVKTAREVFEKRQGDCAGISSAFMFCAKLIRFRVGTLSDGRKIHVMRGTELRLVVGGIMWMRQKGCG